MTNKLKNKKAFTIIEVVLVLAIAGLIFLIVFRALPGLQRSRRDTTRKNDLSAMAAALEDYASNHDGKYPANPTAGSAITTLLPGFSPTNGPQGETYEFGTTTAAGILTYWLGGTCSNDVATAPGGTANGYKYAISMRIENSVSICKAG